MGLNCGGAEYEKRHKPADITMDDLKAAADGQGMEIGETGANLEESGRGIAGGGRAKEHNSAAWIRLCRGGWAPVQKTAPAVLIRKATLSYVEVQINEPNSDGCG